MDKDKYAEWYDDNMPDLIQDFIFEHEDGKQYLWEYVAEDTAKKIEPWFREKQCFEEWCLSKYYSFCIRE